MRIFLIEDDPMQADYWKSEVSAELDCKIVHYETVMDACVRASGNPDVIVFDVGSVGLGQSDCMYLSAFHGLRSHYPHTPIYLISGLSFLPAMIRHELPDDKLIYPITDADSVTAFLDMVKAAT